MVLTSSRSIGWIKVGKFSIKSDIRKTTSGPQCDSSRCQLLGRQSSLRLHFLVCKMDTVALFTRKHRLLFHFKKWFRVVNKFSGNQCSKGGFWVEGGRGEGTGCWLSWPDVPSPNSPPDVAYYWKRQTLISKEVVSADPPLQLDRRHKGKALAFDRNFYVISINQN